ncbi:MAG: 4Fe-4S binding protein [Promethearchaeota archaeon]
MKKEKWMNICEDKDKRPEVLEYKNWKELPPIPISLPIKGNMGTTGDWRTYRPIIDQENCNKCGICWMYCPEAVYCKGCGICAKECPTKNIEMIRESDIKDG